MQVFLQIFLQLVGWFLVLATIADTLFVPNLSSIAHIFSLKEAVAGVTLVAFGNGAGDIFTAISSFSQQPELALGDMIGASVFVTVCTFGLIKYLYPEPDNSEQKQLSLDLGFFWVVIVIWGIFIYFGRLSLLEMMSLLVL